MNKNNVKYPEFSVAMSVYKNDNAEWFDLALESVINQTVKPSEIVLVVDGAIPQRVCNVIDKYIKICDLDGVLLKVIQLPQNQGLGNALKIAIHNCEHEVIARMDSDDIAVINRFEQQLNIMLRDPGIDIVGGDIQEFIDCLDNVTGKRVVPVTDAHIKEYMKKRCPFNHMTVMYRKSALLKAGGYKELFWNEDYYLWIRMAENGCNMRNTGTVLVNARVGNDMHRRRGGIKYFKSEFFLQRYMYKNRLINRRCFVNNVALRFILQILMPNSIRGWAYNTFARSK